MDQSELRAAIEAVLFVSSEPAKIDDLVEAFDESAEAIAAQLDEIKRDLDARAGGIVLEQAAGGWRLATRPEHDSILKKFFARKGENRLSIAALETLAVVAYRQPVTRARVAAVRGVNCDGVLRTLLTRGLVQEAGTDPATQGTLFATTEMFLERLGLDSLTELPPLAPLLPDIDSIDEL